MKRISIKKGLQLKIKYPDLADNIRGRIEAGQYTERLPSLHDLAMEYQAHAITIRKALEILRKEGLIDVRHGSGAFVTRYKHLSIGVVGNFNEEDFPGRFLDNDYYAAVFRPILDRVERQGDVFAYQRKKPETAFHELFRNYSTVDGCLIFTPNRKAEPDLMTLSRKGLPFVVIGGGSSAYAHKEINFVESDNVADSMAGVEQLIHQGHRRIVFMCNYPDTNTQKLRLQGYRQALKKHGLPYDAVLVVMANTQWKSFREKTRRAFCAEPKPTAIFGANIACTERALERLEPEQRDKLEVVVYDDLRRRLARFGRPYTVIVQPLEEIGALAIDTLYECIAAGEQKSARVRLRSKLVPVNPVNLAPS